MRKDKICKGMYLNWRNYVTFMLQLIEEFRQQMFIE